MIGLSWALAAATGTLAACLIAPTTSLEPGYMDKVLVYSFAAATLGGLDSVIGAVVGGIVVGLTISLVTGYIPALGSEFSLGVAFIVIIAVLQFGRPGCSDATSWSECEPRHARRGIREAARDPRRAPCSRRPRSCSSLRSSSGQATQIEQVVGDRGLCRRRFSASSLVTGYCGQISIGHSVVRRHRRLHDDHSRRESRLAVPRDDPGRGSSSASARARSSGSPRCGSAGSTS